MRTRSGRCRASADLYLATNNGCANYNAVQATWVRTKGRYTINLNYTYGKALGIVNFADQFNLNNDYGVQPANRTHIFNAAYSVELGNFTHNKIGGGVINGWQLSGITQWQSGANLTGFSGGANFGMNLNSYTVPSTGFVASNVSLLGTSEYPAQPDPDMQSDVGSRAQSVHQPELFQFPDTDRARTARPSCRRSTARHSSTGTWGCSRISRSAESKKLQFRINGYNFLNHPLWSFNGSNLTLGFDPTTGQMNTPNFGTVTDKQGRRIVQLAVKFFF